MPTAFQAAEFVGRPASQEPDELDYLSSATLTKRKDFLDREAEARTAPNRVLYFRKNADCDKLIAACSKKLRADPRNLRALLIRASSCVKKGDLPSALQDYSSVLVIDPDHLDALVHRGTVNEKLGKLDAAISDFTRVLELEPNHVKAAYARGACRNLKGDFADAIEDYALALEKDQPGSQPQMSRLASGSLWGSRRGSRQNSEALPESAWRVPALHGLGEPTLAANDMQGHAVEVLSDSSASPSPRAPLQPAERRPPTGRGQALRHLNTRGALHEHGFDSPAVTPADTGFRPTVFHSSPHSAIDVSQLPEIGSSRFGPRHSSGTPPAAPSRWETLSAEDPVRPANGSHPEHQPSFPAPASTQTGRPVSQGGHGRSRPHSASSHSSSHSGPSSSHSHEGTSLSNHAHRAPHVADLRSAHGENGASTTSLQDLEKASHGPNLQQHEGWLDAYVDSVAGNQPQAFKPQPASDLPPRMHAGAPQNGMLHHGIPTPTEAQKPAGQLEQHAEFLPEDAEHVAGTEVMRHMRPDGLPVMDQEVNQRGSAAPRSAALRHQGTEGEDPLGLLPALSAAQQADRQRSNAQTGAPPSEEGLMVEATDREAAPEAEQKAVGEAVQQLPSPSPADCMAADQHHAQGYALRKQGNFAEAIQEYSEAIQLQPRHLKSLFNRAFSYDKVGDFEKALADYGQALQVDPQNSFAHYNRGITRDRLGDFAGAVEDFSAAISIDASNADFHHNRGFSLRKQGRFEEAIQDYTRAVALNPRHCRAFYNRAFSYDRLQQFEAAIADYSRALEIEPTNATAFHNRASLLERSGRLEEALQDYGRAIELDSGPTLSLHSRALLLERLGQLPAALADYDQAISLEPSNITFLRNRGNCRRLQGAFAGAVEDFDRVLDRSPEDAGALGHRGYALRKLGRFQPAVADYTAALAQQPGSIRLRNNRGYCLARLGRYADAVADYDAVLELDASNTHALHNRGISYDKMGEYESAISDFTRVLQLDPQNVNAVFNRGSSYDSMGQYDKAVADYSRALDLDASIASSGLQRGSTAGRRDVS